MDILEQKKYKIDQYCDRIRSKLLTEQHSIYHK
jgi:hypothetical protein